MKHIHDLPLPRYLRHKRIIRAVRVLRELAILRRYWLLMSEYGV